MKRTKFIIKTKSKNYPFYIGSRYNAVVPAAGYIGYCRVYGSASEFSASTISDNFDVIKNRYGLS